MQWVVLTILMFAFSATTALSANEPRSILPVKLKEVLVSVGEAGPDSKRLVEIRASAIFSNKCLAPTETMRALRKEAGELTYAFYGAAAEERICTTRYEPVTKLFLIDRFEVPAGQNLPRLSVNGLEAR